MKSNNYAVSPVISTILSVVIIFASISSILAWSVPYMSGIRSETELENTYNQLNLIMDSISDMINGGADSSRSYYLGSEGGSINIDSTGDRIIYSYSFDSDYDFTVADLDDSDETFTVDFTGSTSTPDLGATTYWFSETPSPQNIGTLIPDDDGAIIDYTNVRIDWSSSSILTGSSFSYRLSGYVFQWSSWSDSTDNIYYDLPDGVYAFEVKDNDGMEDEFTFTVIEGKIDQYTMDIDSSASPHFVLSVDPNKPSLESTIRIDLYDGVNLIGRILSFDLGLIEYSHPSMVGEYKNILENNGILSYNSGQEYVRKKPVFSIEIDDPISDTDSWSMFRHDSKHSGYSAALASNTEENDWNYIHDSPSAIESSPAIINGKIYIGSNNGIVYCIDANGNSDGTMDELHVYPSSGYAVKSSPAVVNDKVYFGTVDNTPPLGEVYCYDALSSSLIWVHNDAVAMGKIYSSPAVVGDYVYIGSGNETNDGKVYCLDAEGNGDETTDEWWSYDTIADPPTLGGGVRSSPAVVGDRVYIGTTNGEVYCFDADPDDDESGDIDHTSVGDIDEGNGDPPVAKYDLIWVYSTPLGDDPIYSSPAVAYGNVYFGSLDKNIYCLDIINGNPIWNKPTGGPIYSSPAVAGNKVYVGSDDGMIYCFDAQSGEELWSTTLNDAVRSSPAIAYGNIYVGSSDGSVYCLDANTGVIIYKFDTGEALAIESSPAVVDGKAYFGSMNQYVYCFEGPPKRILASRIVQTRNEGRDSGGSGSIRLDITKTEDYVLEMMTDIYNVEMQIHGDHASLWLDYFGELDLITPIENEENKLELAVSDPVIFLLTRSLCKVSIV